MKYQLTLRAFKIATLSFFVATSVGASGITDDPDHDNFIAGDLVRPDPNAAMIAHDASMADVISSGPSAKVIKNLAPSGRGERLSPNSTTDVWALGKYAYTGTFSNPCGGQADAGIFVWDVHNHNKVTQAGFIASEAGDRTNDVKAASMNSGDILVMSNESCGGGDGGFEIYNVDDPTAPVLVKRMTSNEDDGGINTIPPLFFAPGALDFVGVHNVFLFTQGSYDYVAVVAEGVFDNFRIYNITNPGSPTLVGGWGAEELCDSPACLANPLPSGIDDYSDLTLAEDPTGAITLAGINWLFAGFGASQNKFLHDVTISEDGTRAYLSNWDAGLVLLDISDPANPSLVSVALDVANGSLDGEVNSHAAWPNADGSVVVEGEEDFSAFATTFSVDGLGQFPVAEGAITVPIDSLSGQEMSGPTTYVGLACGSVASGSGIALIQRGACDFTIKDLNVIVAGYSGMVVFNDAARGDALVTMGGPAVSIPGVFVGHSTGLAIAGVASAGDLVIGASGTDVSATTTPNAWSGLRFWNYSDPANPVLASTFNTVCSANPVDASCDAAGTYSVHNVVVEGNKVYISWYSDGVLIVDFSDLYNPVEVGRYTRSDADFLAQNGGPQDVWGIYKVNNSPWVYASDRTGGLYVLKEYGAGSAKKGKK